MKKIFLLLILGLLLTGCSQSLDTSKNEYSSDLLDGNYKATSTYYDSQGFRKELEISVNKGIISDVNYEEIERNGTKRLAANLIPTWQNSNLTYSQIVSELYEQTIIKQGATIDTISGATKTVQDYNILLAAVVEASETGNEDTQIIDSFNDTYTVINNVDPVNGSQEEITVTYKDGKINSVDIREISTDVQLLSVKKQYNTLATLSTKAKSLDNLDTTTVDTNVLNRYNELLDQVRQLRENT